MGSTAKGYAHRKMEGMIRNIERRFANPGFKGALQKLVDEFNQFADLVDKVEIMDAAPYRARVEWIVNPYKKIAELSRRA